MADKSKRWNDRDAFSGERNAELGLREMCDFGAAEVAKGHAEEVRFNLFNQSEANFVRRYMAEKYPAVKFTRTWIVLKEPPHE